MGRAPSPAVRLRAVASRTLAAVAHPASRPRRLRRTTAISRYTKYFMFPRRLAVEAAQNLLSGYETASVESKIVAEIENWLGRSRRGR